MSMLKFLLRLTVTPCPFTYEALSKSSVKLGLCVSYMWSYGTKTDFYYKIIIWLKNCLQRVSNEVW